jgi:hypothetical protein
MRRSTAFGIAALMIATFCASAGGNDVLIEDPTKWIQEPDLCTGLDVQSQWNPLNQDPDDGTYNPDVIKADDWICNGLPIADIHWWGSYGNNERTPVTGFHILIYDNNPGGAGIDDDLPGTVQQHWFVDFANANEAYYDDDQIPTTQNPPDDFEHVYFYSWYLPELFPQVQGTKYWLSIVAETPQVEGSVPMWGWHTGFQPAGLATTSAVTGKVMAYSDRGEGNPAEWEPMTDPHYYDLAFALTTVPEPATCAVIGLGALGLAALRRRKQR